MKISIDEKIKLNRDIVLAKNITELLTSINGSRLTDNKKGAYKHVHSTFYIDFNSYANCIVCLLKFMLESDYKIKSSTKNKNISELKITSENNEIREVDVDENGIYIKLDNSNYYYMRPQYLQYSAFYDLSVTEMDYYDDERNRVDAEALIPIWPKNPLTVVCKQLPDEYKCILTLHGLGEYVL